MSISLINHGDNWMRNKLLGTVAALALAMSQANAIPIPLGYSELTLVPKVPMPEYYSAYITINADQTACFVNCTERWLITTNLYDQDHNSLGGSYGQFNEDCHGNPVPVACGFVLPLYAGGELPPTTAMIVLTTFVSVDGGWIFRSADLVLSGIQIAETPLPATFPLFAFGLGLIGLLRWRINGSRS